MGIENGDKISDLNPLWPLGTDPVSQGDDQIRLIKNVMVNDALGKSEGGTISADLTVDGDLTVDNITADNVTADSITADSITADSVTVNNNLTALSGGLGGTFEPVLTAKQTRSSKSLEQNIITSATDAIGVWSGFQFEVSKGDATADTDLIASITRNGLQVDSINVANGITFGAGTTALDEYEEGTWTPTVSAVNGGFAGTVGIYSANYTRIGPAVWVDAYIEVNVTALGSGGARIGGLPFTVASVAPFKAAHGDLVQSNGGYFQGAGATDMRFTTDKSISDIGFVVTGTRYMMVSGHYRTDE